MNQIKITIAEIMNIIKIIGMESGKKNMILYIILVTPLLFMCRKNPKEVINKNINDFIHHKEISKSYLTEIDSVTKREIYLSVEELPYFGDTTFCFSEFILKRMSSPPDHELYKVQFVIDENGYLLGARIKNKKQYKLTETEKKY